MTILSILISTLIICLLFFFIIGFSAVGSFLGGGGINYLNPVFLVILGVLLAPVIFIILSNLIFWKKKLIKYILTYVSFFFSILILLFSLLTINNFYRNIKTTDTYQTDEYLINPDDNSTDSEIIIR